MSLLCVGVLSACTDELPTVSLTVTVDGPGTIVSDPAGITCGSTCTATFPLGTVVGLHAQPQANAKAVGFDATFVEYTGALCPANNPRCWFTLAADAKASAKFAPVPTSCTDGVRNGTETDVDCGGSCGRCGIDAACQANGDCDNGQCAAGLCSACPLDTNLLFNGDAESGMPGSSAPGWTFSPAFAVDVYGGGNLAASDPGPAMRGSNFFLGGVSAQSSASATVDLAKCAKLIDKGKAVLKVSGYLGGYASQDDNIVVQFGIKQGTSVTSQVSMGPVLAADRGNVSGLIMQQASTPLPPGTCGLQVQMTATRRAGVYNDGYADNITAMVSLQ